MKVADTARERAELVAQVTQFFTHAKELSAALPVKERAQFAQTYLDMVALAKQLGIDYKKLESGR